MNGSETVALATLCGRSVWPVLSTPHSLCLGEQYWTQSLGGHGFCLAQETMQASISIIILVNQETLICPYIVAFQELCWEKQGLPTAAGGNVLSHCFTSTFLASKPLTSPVSLAEPSTPGAEGRSEIDPQASYHPTAEVRLSFSRGPEGILRRSSLPAGSQCGGGPPVWVSETPGLHPDPSPPPWMPVWLLLSPGSHGFL